MLVAAIKDEDEDKDEEGRPVALQTEIVARYHATSMRRSESALHQAMRCNEASKHIDWRLERAFGFVATGVHVTLDGAVKSYRWGYPGSNGLLIREVYLERNCLCNSVCDKIGMNAQL